MWLGNDVLKVFFDEDLGGMPTADSFGILRAVSIEIARTRPFPFFQSLYDTRSRIKCDGSRLVASGVMCKPVPPEDFILPLRTIPPLGEISPHTYEMEATVEGNRLSLAYRLNVAAEEKIVHSKIWMWTKPFQSYTIDGETFNVRNKQPAWVEHCAKSGGTWYFLEARAGQPKSITLFDSSGRLRISGATIPPCYTEIQRYEHEKMEVVYGWAKNLLQKGTYSGKLELTYDG